MKLDLNFNLLDGTTGKEIEKNPAYRSLAIILQNIKTSLDIDWCFDNAVKLCSNNGIIEISDVEAERLKTVLRTEVNQPPYILAQICKKITDAQLFELESKKKSEAEKGNTQVKKK